MGKGTTHELTLAMLRQQTHMQFQKNSSDTPASL